MAFPAVRTGFCGCSLKSSSIFIAWFSLIVAIISLLSVTYMGIGKVDQFSQIDDESAATAQKFAEMITVIVTVIFAIILILNVIMLVGIYKEQPCLIFPYVCVKAGILCLALMGVVQMFFKGHLSSRHMTTLIYGFSEAYFLFVIYSFCQELKDKRILNSVYNRQQIVITEDGYNKGNFPH